MEWFCCVNFAFLKGLIRMKIYQFLLRFLRLLVAPIRLNGLFCVSMYLLGCISAWTTLLPYKHIHLYENLYWELFLDVYLAAVFLAILPSPVRRWARRVMYVVFYAVAFIDVYCFQRFGSTLNPTMLLLVGETNSREAGEFFKTYLTTELFTGKMFWLWLLLIVHAVLAFCAGLFRRNGLFPSGDTERNYHKYEPLLGCCILLLLIISAINSSFNKQAVAHIMTRQNVGDMERLLTGKHHAELYKPIDRLIFSIQANRLAARQLDKLVAGIDQVQVDSCSFRVPSIVLIIGESYGKTHSQQFGYALPTTPRQIARQQTGRLIPFDDVIASWNLTSFVFKEMFSMHTVGQEGEWCDYPLFTELFKKAGYQVTFLTNQFLPKAKEAVYDFSGGFFLNNPQLSDAQFTRRNSQVHRYDKALLDDYDRLAPQDGPRLTIFHLMGQHVNYSQRTPLNRRPFNKDTYKDSRRDLTDGQREILANYDNATLYNDSIVDLICGRFEGQDAVVIYMPDHGEECYEGNRKFFCRNHQAAIDYELAHYEFDIPFWMYCTERFVKNHPDLFEEIKQAQHRRLMTDVVAHTLVYLGGISTPSYNEKYNVLSPKYDNRRPRIIKNTVDYDTLKPKQPRK